MRVILISILLFALAITSCKQDTYNLVWEDDFNYEGIADPVKWTYRTGGLG